MNRGIYVFLIAVLLLQCAVSFPLRAKAEDPEPVALVAKTLDGSTFNLAALKGKVVVVHFWATWCGPCKEEMPLLNKLYTHYHAQGVEVIGLSVDHARERDAVKAYMHDFQFPAGLVSDMEANSLGMPDAIPVTYIFDKEGRLRNVLSPDTQKLSAKELVDVVLLLVSDGKQQGDTAR